MKIKSLVLIFLLGLIMAINLSGMEKQGAMLLIKQLNGQYIQGELIAVKDDSLLILGSRSGTDVTVAVRDIEAIKIIRKSKLLPGMGAGLLVGYTVGTFYGLTHPGSDAHEDAYPIWWALTMGVPAAVAGGIIGGLLGIDSSIDFKGKTKHEIAAVILKLEKKARVHLNQSRSKKTGPRFTLKFMNGIGAVLAGDINTVIGDTEKLYKDKGYSGYLRKLKHIGFENNGGVIFNLKEKFALGLEAGILKRYGGSSGSIYSEIMGLQSSSFIFRPELTCYPLRISVYHFLLNSDTIRTYVAGGVGIYFSEINCLISTHTYGHYPHMFYITDETRFESSTKGFGLHIGAGFDLEITSFSGFFVELRSRYCRLTNWKGAGYYHYSQRGDSPKEIHNDLTGTLWISERYSPEFDQYYSTLILSNEKPTEPEYRNTRKFNFDLTGLSFRIGFIIRF